MSGPPTAKRRPLAGAAKAEQTGQVITDPSAGVAQHEPDTLFDAIAEHGAYGNRRVTITEHPPEDDRTGPGAPRPTRGPGDASAPAWWVVEAERIVLALVQSGHKVSSDDLHERYPHEPSATGAAFGALFQRLAGRGLIVEVGMVRSTRPEARRRRIILWAAGPGR